VGGGKISSTIILLCSADGFILRIADRRIRKSILRFCPGYRIREGLVVEKTCKIEGFLIKKEGVFAGRNPQS